MRLPILVLLLALCAVVTGGRISSRDSKFAGQPKSSLPLQKPSSGTAKNLPSEVKWVTVPAGPFTYGRKDEQRTLSTSFQIMKYCVTNAQFAAYLNKAYRSDKMQVKRTLVKGHFRGDKYWKADVYQYLFLSRDGCKLRYDDSRFSVEVGFENHPVVQVSWFGANAFAEYYGYRLPTEKEWEKAARGNTGWDYPWGDAIDGSMANYWRSGDPFDNHPTPVGYFNGATHGGFQTTDSPSPYGVYDMAGSVAMWTGSYWTKTKKTQRLYREVRGGSYHAIKSEVKSWGRKDLNPWQGYPTVGFRCVR